MGNVDCSRHHCPALIGKKETSQVRPFQITSDRPIAIAEGYLEFSALDGEGKLSIWVSIATWERFQAEAPPFSDADDRQDYAFGMIEVQCVDLAPVLASGGQRLIMIA